MRNNKGLVLFLLLFIGIRLVAEQTSVSDSLNHELKKLEQSKTKDSLALFNGYHRLTHELSQEGQEKKADIAFRKNLKYAFNDSLKFIAYYSRATALSSNRNYEPSMTLSAEMIKELPNNMNALSAGYLLMAVGYEQNGNAKSALKYYAKAHKAALATRDASTVFMIEANMANTLLDNGFIDSALSYYKSALNYSFENDNKEHAVSLLNNIGTAYLGQNSDSVLKYLNMSIELGEELNDKYAISLAALNLGIEYFSRGNIVEAEKNLRMSLKFYNAMELFDYHYDIYRHLAAIEAAKKAWKKASSLLDSAQIFTDSINNVFHAQAFADARAEFELAEQELKNQLLENQNAEAQKTITYQRMSSALLICVVLLLLLFVVFRYRQFRINKELNAHLKEKNNKLNQLVFEKDNLMGILFHDLRSPMASIKMVSDMLIEDKDMNINPEAEELLSEMAKVSEYGLNLVNTLYSIYEIENKLIHVKKSMISLSEILLEMHDEFSAIAKSKGVLLRIDKCELSIPTHREFLISIIRNLISNAIKFSSDGMEIKIWAEEKGEKVILHIKDEGPGFSEEDKKNMFQKFKTLSAKPTSGEKSSGLGLYLVRLLGEKISAEINLNPLNTEGAEFLISIPKSE